MQCMKIFTVTCLFVGVCQCAGIALSELEEFNEFLHKTSQLDQILKKGNDVDDDFDENEPISDDAWEESGKFEGDLILNDKQRRVILKDVTEGLARNGLTDSTKKWPDNEVIYYIQREHFSGDQVQAIQDGIDDLSRASCIKFRPYKKGDRDAVVIQGSRRGCFSQVGYQGGYQVLNLSGRHPVGKGCFRHGTVVHELLHTLGFFHMQSSPDRDDYINVHWNNIIQPARHNFRKYSAFDVSDFGVGYDYDSVLHYSRRAFSANGRDTLVPKQSGASIGQRVGLSDKDTQKLNKMYCDAGSDNHDEEEKPTQKPIVVKKKSPKNKPFEGHGIGYHQGKTIAIKIPTAKTIKLSNILPTIHLFDDFSKAPETVPSTLTEGFGTRQEVKDLYKSPVIENTEEYDDFIPPHEENYANHDNDEENIKIHDTDNTTKFITDISKDFQEDENIPSKTANDDISEAFERLGKIIKTHVTPSHTPDFSIYQNNFSDFVTPTTDFDHETEMAKIDEAYHSSTEKFLGANEENPGDDSQRKPFVESSTSSHFNENQTFEETNSSYGTRYPPKIKIDEHDKTEYSVENNKSSELKDDSTVINKGIFDYVIPVYGRFYKSNEFKTTPNEYVPDSHINAAYPSSADNNDINKSYTKNSESYEYSESNRKPYKLVGLIVPLANKWYYRDYEPAKYIYPVDKINPQDVTR